MSNVEHPLRWNTMPRSAPFPSSKFRHRTAVISRPPVPQPRVVTQVTIDDEEQLRRFVENAKKPDVRDVIHAYDRSAVYEAVGELAFSLVGGGYFRAAHNAMPQMTAFTSLAFMTPQDYKHLCFVGVFISNARRDSADNRFSGSSNDACVVAMSGVHAIVSRSRQVVQPGMKLYWFYPDVVFEEGAPVINNKRPCINPMPLQGQDPKVLNASIVIGDRNTIGSESWADTVAGIKSRDIVIPDDAPSTPVKHFQTASRELGTFVQKMHELNLGGFFKTAGTIILQHFRSFHDNGAGTWDHEMASLDEAESTLLGVLLVTSYAMDDFVDQAGARARSQEMFDKIDGSSLSARLKAAAERTKDEIQRVGLADDVAVYNAGIAGGFDNAGNGQNGWTRIFTGRLAEREIGQIQATMFGHTEPFPRITVNNIKYVAALVAYARGNGEAMEIGDLGDTLRARIQYSIDADYRTSTIEHLQKVVKEMHSVGTGMQLKTAKEALDAVNANSMEWWCENVKLHDLETTVFHHFAMFHENFMTRHFIGTALSNASYGEELTILVRS